MIACGSGKNQSRTHSSYTKEQDPFHNHAGNRRHPVPNSVRIGVSQIWVGLTRQAIASRIHSWRRTCFIS